MLTQEQLQRTPTDFDGEAFVVSFHNEDYAVPQVAAACADRADALLIAEARQKGARYVFSVWHVQRDARTDEFEIIGRVWHAGRTTPEQEAA
jgi:hypothetical protein